MCLYRGAFDYGSFLIIIVFSFKSCLSRLMFFMSPLRCTVDTLFSLGKNYVIIGFSLCVLWDRHCGQRGVYRPGNCGSNIAAGSHFGFSLLWVVWLSGFLAVYFQYLAGLVGISGAGLLDLFEARLKGLSLCWRRPWWLWSWRRTWLSTWGS